MNVKVEPSLLVAFRRIGFPEEALEVERNKVVKEYFGIAYSFVSVCLPWRLAGQTGFGCAASFRDIFF